MTKDEIYEVIRRFRPIDDTFFEVLVQKPKVCEEILRVILQDEELVVEQVVPQAHLRNLYGRSVCLDALCVMQDGRRCNVEVQRANNDDHLRRVRFNASLITALDSKPGTDFKEVINLCVVYITEQDFLKAGRTVYHVDKILRETGTVVDDGLREVFVNAEVNDYTDIAELMECFKQQKIENGKFPELSAEVKRLKETEGGCDTMCELMQEFADKVRKESLAEGKAEAIICLLEKRNDLPDNLREIIRNQTDSKVLHMWLLAAAEATGTEDWKKRISEADK